MAQPLAVKSLLELKTENEAQDDTTTIVSPTSFKPKAGQTVPGGPQNALRLAAGALHNLSTNISSVIAIREAGGVVPLVRLLEYVYKFVDIFKFFQVFDIF